MKKLRYIVMVIIIVFTYSCSLYEDNANNEVLDMSDWSEESHGNTGDPDYDVVFSDTEVKRLDIEISAGDWQDMLSDMQNKYGTFGGGNSRPGDDLENPIFVPSSLYFEGKQWYKVGIRFKGNSSLRNAWGWGVWKLALKLDFNEYGDEYPELEEQRFYGFRQLSLSNNFDDTSLLRERVVPEIFREMGVVAPRTAFYRVYINHGDGSIYFGLYTAVEVVDDTMLKNQFGSENGNCYKPDGTGASFASGTFNETYFVKKNNEEEEDWSDVEALYDNLHSSDRLNDMQQWRNQLESVFDVNGFIRWLAVNTVIQNWDTYGNMTHNYYLYNDLSGSLLTWIPWDNNEALDEGKMRGALSISLTEAGSDWPLIRYLMNDYIYKSFYIKYIEEVINTAFEPAKMQARYLELHNLIQPFVTGSDGENSGYTFLSSSADFETGYLYLLNHVNSRYSVTENYLNQQ